MTTLYSNLHGRWTKLKAQVEGDQEETALTCAIAYSAYISAMDGMVETRGATAHSSQTETAGGPSIFLSLLERCSRIASEEGSPGSPPVDLEHSLH